MSFFHFFGSLAFVPFPLCPPLLLFSSSRKDCVLACVLSLFPSSLLLSLSSSLSLFSFVLSLPYISFVIKDLLVLMLLCCVLCALLFLFPSSVLFRSSFSPRVGCLRHHRLLLIIVIKVSLVRVFSCCVLSAILRIDLSVLSCIFSPPNSRYFSDHSLFFPHFLLGCTSFLSYHFAHQFISAFLHLLPTQFTISRPSLAYYAFLHPLIIFLTVCLGLCSGIHHNLFCLHCMSHSPICLCFSASFIYPHNSRSVSAHSFFYHNLLLPSMSSLFQPSAYRLINHQCFSTSSPYTIHGISLVLLTCNLFFSLFSALSPHCSSCFSALFPYC